MHKLNEYVIVQFELECIVWIHVQCTMYNLLCWQKTKRETTNLDSVHNEAFCFRICASCLWLVGSNIRLNCKRSFLLLHRNDEKPIISACKMIFFKSNYMNETKINKFHCTFNMAFAFKWWIHILFIICI